MKRRREAEEVMAGAVSREPSRVLTRPFSRSNFILSESDRWTAPAASKVSSLSDFGDGEYPYRLPGAQFLCEVNLYGLPDV